MVKLMTPILRRANFDPDRFSASFESGWVELTNFDRDENCVFLNVGKNW